MPIARRCAPTAPATAAIPQASRRSISRSTLRLRPGDVIATTDGLVAYSGVKVGDGQTAEFTPVASYPGLTPDVRARLGGMKVAPVRAEMIANDAVSPEASRDVVLPVTTVPKSATLGRSGRKRIRIFRVDPLVRSAASLVSGRVRIAGKTMRPRLGVRPSFETALRASSG